MISRLRGIKNKIDYSVEQSFDNEFLENKRQEIIEWVTATKKIDSLIGITNLLTQLYPDNAHFIYELLQNAEDAGATKVYFSLQEDCLYFLHNGAKGFSNDDIVSITSIGRSLKKDDKNKIGKFGVGFKSVFSYTNTPSVHSSSVSFLIKDLFLPSKLEKEELPNGYTTLFIFPFNNPDKPKKQAYDEVFGLFDKLSNNTLLFLSGIQEINWIVNEQDCNSIKRKSRGNYIEIHSTSGDSSYWYVFTKTIHIETSNESSDFDVKIAYAFDQDEKTIIETRGGVSIFFPADSEVSELKFHMHAPFASTVARDSIVKNNEENQQLIQGIAELCCESLYEIKNNKMLNTSFFAVLPNEDDELSNTYLPIYERIVEEFEDESNDLIPIGNNKFSNLKNCRFTKSNIKNVFDKGDLTILLSDEDIQGFAINASQINNRTDRFLKSLNRLTFYEDDLIECLNELDHDVTDEQMEVAIYYEDDDRIEEINLKRKWLENKSNDWLQSLYALLFDFSELYSLLNSVDELTSIIKLSDNSFNFSKDSVYFSESDQHDSQFKFVNQATYLSGKKEKQKQKSKEFLEYVGVKDLDESIHIKLLFQDYEFESEDQHIKDIDRLVQFYIDENSMDSDFRNFNFIYTNQQKMVNPSRISIDTPFESTGLQYVSNYQNTELLSPIYQNLKNIGVFLDLLKNLGAHNSIKIQRTSINKNPERMRMVQDAKGDRLTSTAINRDWTIENLEGMLADRDHRREVSKLLWDTMYKVDSKYFEAQYRMNSAYATVRARSQLIHVISNATWVHGADGEFYNPKDIDKESLSSDFIYNNENGWLDHIDFGLNIQFTTEEQDKAEELIKEKTGFTLDMLEKFKGIPLESIDEFVNQEKQRRRLKVSMDENQGSGETEKIAPSGDCDEIITDEKRLQKDISNENKNVDTSSKSSIIKIKRLNKEELTKVKNFLYKQYKGHCQICGDTFKGSQSQNYYDTYSINRGKNRDVNRKGNTLCLCPKHHAILSENLHNFSFIELLPDQDLTIGKIRERFSHRGGVGRIDMIYTNDGFFALDEDDHFEIDAFLLPIKIFNKNFYIKFTQEHLQNFVEVWNEN